MSSSRGSTSYSSSSGPSGERSSSGNSRRNRSIRPNTSGVPVAGNSLPSSSNSYGMAGTNVPENQNAVQTQTGNDYSQMGFGNYAQQADQYVSYQPPFAQGQGSGNVYQGNQLSSNPSASNQLYTVNSIPMPTNVSNPSDTQSSNRHYCVHTNCNGSCRRPSDLRRHEDSIHTDQVFHCLADGCRRTYNRKDKMQEHMRNKHSKEEPRKTPADE